MQKKMHIQEQIQIQEGVSHLFLNCIRICILLNV